MDIRKGVVDFHLINISLITVRVMKAIATFLELDREDTKEVTP